MTDRIEPVCNLRVEWRRGVGNVYPLTVDRWRDEPMAQVDADAQVVAWLKAEKPEDPKRYREYLYSLLRWATEPQTRHFGRMVAWGQNAGLVVADDGGVHRLQFDWLRACASG